MKRISIQSLLFSFLMLCSFVCAASSVVMNPVRLEIAAGKTNTSFLLTNKGDENTAFEIKAVKWRQENGQDIYEDAKEILINPPIANLTAGDYQLFRIGLRAPLTPKTEHAYRIIATELETEKKAVEGFTLKTLFQFNVPLFIKPQTVEENLVWSIKQLADQNIEIKLINKSNVHVQITGLSLAQADEADPFLTQDTFVYLLPNQEKTWSIPFKNSIAGNNISLNARTDWGERIESLRIAQ